MKWWRCTLVLFGKNWRVKQRQSGLNKKLQRMQLPPLVGDVILPLIMFLLLIRMLCSFNAASNNGTNGNNGQGLTASTALAPGGGGIAGLLASMSNRNPKTDLGVRSEMLMTALPLLLQRADYQLVLTTRPESELFLQFLDAKYPPSEQLGMPSYTQSVKNVTPQEAKQFISRPKLANKQVYAVLDVTHATDKTLRLSMTIDRPAPAQNQVETNLVKQLVLEKNGNYEPLTLPNILAFQIEMDAFVRSQNRQQLQHNTRSLVWSDYSPLRNSIQAKRAHTVNASSVNFPKQACAAVNEMLEESRLKWQMLGSGEILGANQQECESRLKNRSVDKETRDFLASLVSKQASQREFQLDGVSKLVEKPAKTSSGMMESNIVMYMAYMFMWPLVRLVRDIVTEKESQLKEYLLIMGVPSMALLLSWFLLYLYATTVVGVLAVCMLSNYMFDASAWTSQANFFLFLMSFSLSVLCFGMAITPIFSQAKTAATGAPLMYMLLGAASYLRTLVDPDTLDASFWLRMAFSAVENISSPVVFMETLRKIMSLNAPANTLQPVTIEKVFDPSMQMLAQTLGYIVLGWYLEKVFPRTFGVQHPWYFLFQKSYWFPQSNDIVDESGNPAHHLVMRGAGNGEEDSAVRERPVDDFFTRFHPVVLVRKLWKTYGDGTVAVRNLSFGVKKGEIFGLLGTNGAGKSTTMSVLSGILQPTQGDAFVGTHSVSRNPHEIRKSLSVCFQQNILFGELSVGEHLALVCDLKSILGVKTTPSTQWDDLLLQFGLLEKQTALADTLSGGQKRKLSLVLALLDDSKLLLLDEPTAGMDLKARYDTWGALKNAVRTRAVILTTHMMQEAEALCGSIGIMAEGMLKCCGTSLFLRETFGVGYKLTVVLQSPGVSNSEAVSSQKVLEAVRSVVGEAMCLSENKWEMRMRIPAGHENAFAVLFEKLEALKKADKICGYSIAATDLEDVFVRVTQGEDMYYDSKEDDEKPKKDNDKSKLPAPYDDVNATSRRVESTIHERRALQLRALIQKRCKTAARDRKALLAQYIWPFVIFLFLAFMVKPSNDPTRGGEPLAKLPSPTARETSLLIASNVHNDQAAAFAQYLSTEMSSSAVFKSRILFKDLVQLNQSFDDAVTKEPEPLYAAVHLRKLDLSKPLIDMELQYNASIESALLASSRQVSEAYCRAIKAFKNGESTSSSSILTAHRGSDDKDRGVDIQASHNDAHKEECHLDVEMKPIANDASASFKMLENVSTHIITGYNLLLLFSSVTALYVVTVVKERESGLQRFQYLHGVQTLVYWLAHLVFDLSCFLGCCFAAGVVVYFVGPSEVIVSLGVLFLCFAGSVIPFVHFCSQFFDSATSAQSIMAYVGLFQIVIVSLDFAFALVPGLCYHVARYVGLFHALPLFTFGRAILKLATSEWQTQRDLCVKYSSAAMDGNQTAQEELQKSFADLFDGKQGNPVVSGAWVDPMVVEDCIWMVFMAFVYYGLVLVIDAYRMYPIHFVMAIRKWVPFFKNRAPEYQSLNRPDQNHENDDPVPFGSKMLQVKNLTKIYEAKGNARHQVVAVDDLNFSMETNENVALLGVNGSGKSTTFEILTASLVPTQGQVLVEGHDVTTCDPELITNSMAYCPQKNIFFDNLTVYEHLEFVRRLRQSQWTVRCSQRENLENERKSIQTLLNSLDLTKVQHVAAKKLSGGTKRRLMLAIALVCDEVPLLLLDEPSAGVDVVARRLMWRALQQKCASGKARGCLFTTHSMEEAEAVCANAVVLRKGKRVWWGSIQSLKQKVAAGICISVRLDYESTVVSDKVVFLMDQVLRSLNLPRDPRPSEETTIAHDQLMEAWKICCRFRDRMAPNKSDASEEPDGASLASDSSSRWIDKYFNESEGRETINLSDFVTEWLVREQMEHIYSALSQRIAQLGGTDVVFAEQNGVTRGVFETRCNEKFGLSQCFALMEQLRVAFGIVQYHVSELSLERVFEQFALDDD